jgi:hypothetical protein
MIIDQVQDYHQPRSGLLSRGRGRLSVVLGNDNLFLPAIGLFFDPTWGFLIDPLPTTLGQLLVRIWAVTPYIT